MRVPLNVFLYVFRKRNTTGIAVRSLKDGRVQEEIPHQYEKVEQIHQGSHGVQVPIGVVVNEVLVVPPDMTNGEIRESLFAIARAMKTQVNRDVEPRMNVF